MSWNIFCRAVHRKKLLLPIQIWDLFWIRPETSLGALSQELCLIWETSEAEEWINNLDWIPF